MAILTVSRVRSLNDVDRTSGGDDRDTETKQEATTLELADVAVEGGCSVDDGADDDDPSANLHANLSSPSVDSWADKKQGADTTDLVHCGVEGSPWAIVSAVEEVEELLVRRQTTEHGAIESVLVRLSVTWPRRKTN